MNTVQKLGNKLVALRTATLRRLAHLSAHPNAPEVEFIEAVAVSHRISSRIVKSTFQRCTSSGNGNRCVRITISDGLRDKELVVRLVVGSGPGRHYVSLEFPAAALFDVKARRGYVTEVMDRHSESTLCSAQNDYAAYLRMEARYRDPSPLDRQAIDQHAKAERIKREAEEARRRTPSRIAQLGLQRPGGQE